MGSSALQIVGLILLGVAFVIGSMYFERKVSSVSVQIKTQEVAPGVSCAVASSHDGVAIDCWKD